MSMVVAALRALPTTFAIYVIEAAVALWLTTPFTAELTGDVRALGARPLFRAAALERSLELVPVLRVEGRALALGALALLVLAPFLRMAWFAALAGTSGVRAALSCGTTLYLRAVLVSLGVCATLLVLLAPFGLFAYLVDRFVEVGVHARLHDVLLAGALAGALPLLFFAHVALDLAHAFALRHGALASVRLGFSAARAWRALMLALALGVLGLSVSALPFTFGTSWGQGELFRVALIQSACFSALFVRSLWLGYALTCAQRRATSREPA